MFNYLLALAIAGAIQAGASAEPKFKYILPEGFNEWACVDFGVQKAPLKRDAEGLYIVNAVTNGIVATSSFPHMHRSPFVSQLMKTENGQLRRVEVHDTASRGEYVTLDPVSRYCLFFGSNQEAALVPRPPRLKESQLGTTPLLQRFEFSQGSLCDFRDISRVCLEATDMSQSNIAKTIGKTIPEVPMSPAESCDGFDGIVVHYQAQWSIQRDASVPRSRDAFGHVRRNKPGKGTVALAAWIDVDGGEADEVATRFGRELADLFQHAAVAACGK